MQRVVALTLAIGVASFSEANAQSYSRSYHANELNAPSHNSPSQTPQFGYSAHKPDLGGGFIEFLFGGQTRQAPAGSESARPVYRQQPEGAGGHYRSAYIRAPIDSVPAARQQVTPAAMQVQRAPAHPEPDPRYLKQVVDYSGPERPGTLVIDTPNRFLFLVEEDGKALRYGIGVGRPGFAWAGVKHVTAKREWPDWRPPKEMLERRPDLPTFVAGGLNNPLGARAMYLGSTLYRIHGSNEPWTIGQAVSSGCIRMRNEDVIDLYERVPVGAKVIVI